MSHQIADSLVLVFPRGFSLRDWRAAALLEREWAALEPLVPHYGRTIVVTHGGTGDAELLRSVRGDRPGDVRLITSEPGRTSERTLVDRILQELDGSASTLVRTHQLTAGSEGAEIRDRLRRSGTIAALIARGGYVWSRLTAQEHGAESAMAQSAAAHEGVLCRSADLVVGTTPKMIDDLAWRYQLESHRTAVVPNAVVCPESLPDPAARDSGLIVFAGRLIARKRVHVILKAVAQLPENLREGKRIEILGDGPELSHLRTLASELNVPTTFEPTPTPEMLNDRLSRCTLFVHAAEFETQSKMLLEAMARGAAVIVADTPGLGTSVENGVNGLRVQGGSPEGFTYAMTGLLTDDDWRAMLGTAAATHVRTHHHIDRVSEQELKAHRRAINLAELWHRQRRTGDAA